MAAEDVEIRTELALVGIEQIKSDLRDVRARFGEVDKGRETAQRGFGDWIGTAHQLAGVLGTNLSSIIDRVRGMGAEFLHAGSAAETGDQAVAALISTAQGRGAQESIETARMLGDELDVIAMKAGVSGEAIGNAYQIILERTGATENGVVRATEQIDKMATVAGRLGKDVGAIAGEFALMEEGQVRTRGQLFQLLQSTGIFGEKTKDAAKTWGALTDEKRAELLASGLDQLSSKMEKMPPTFAQAQAGFENMIRISKEKVGEPIIRELTPALKEVADEVMKLGPDLEDLGHVLAKEVGAGVREGGRLFKEALVWLRDHKAEIAEDLRKAGQFVRSAFEFVLAHKEEIAIAFGAKAFGPSALGAGKALVGGAASIAQAGASGGLGALSLGAQGANLTGAAGAIASLGLLSAAIVALGAVAYAEYQLIDGLSERWDNQTESLRRLYALAEQGKVEDVEDAAAAMREIKVAGGDLTPQLDELYTSTVRLAHATHERMDEENRGSDVLRTAIGRQMNILRDVGVAASTQGISQAQQISNSTAVLTSAYEIAIRSGNTAAATLAAQTIAGNDQVKLAFLQSATDIEGGFANMADLLLAGGGQFAGFAQQLKGKTAAPPAPKISMPGARITVQQNFRNQDPDRVAVVFKRDLARQVERRTSARYSGIFGN